MDVRVADLIKVLSYVQKTYDNSFYEIRGVIAELDLRGDKAYLGLIKEIIDKVKRVENNFVGLIISVIINEFIKKREIEFDTDINANYLFYKLKNKKITVKGDINAKYMGAHMSGGTITANNIEGFEIGTRMSGGVIEAGKMSKGETGSHMSGGAIIANNIIGNDVGRGMSGGLITAKNIIKGDKTGYEMTGGTITANNINGGGTGDRMTGGVIFVKGKIIGESAENGKMGGIIISQNKISEGYELVAKILLNGEIQNIEELNALNKLVKFDYFKRFLKNQEIKINSKLLGEKEVLVFQRRLGIIDIKKLIKENKELIKITFDKKQNFNKEELKLLQESLKYNDAFLNALTKFALPTSFISQFMRFRLRGAIEHITKKYGLQRRAYELAVNVAIKMAGSVIKQLNMSYTRHNEGLIKKGIKPDYRMSIETPMGDRTVNIMENRSSIKRKLKELIKIMESKKETKPELMKEELTKSPEENDEEPETLSFNPDNFKYTSINTTVRAMHILTLIIPRGETYEWGQAKFEFKGMTLKFKKTVFKQILKLFPKITNYPRGTLNNKVIILQQRAMPKVEIEKKAFLAMDMHIPLRRHYSRIKGELEVTKLLYGLNVELKGKLKIRFIDQPGDIHTFLRYFAKKIGAGYEYKGGREEAVSEISCGPNKEQIKQAIITVYLITNLAGARFDAKKFAELWYEKKIKTGAYKKETDYTALHNFYEGLRRNNEII